jgi:hypothetical protein
VAYSTKKRIPVEPTKVGMTGKKALAGNLGFLGLITQPLLAVNFTKNLRKM